MANFYLDEDVSERLLTPLQAAGHNPISVGLLRQKGWSDAQQLLYAADTRRVLVTHNAKGYVLLQAAWTLWSTAWGSTAVARHSGVLVIYASKGLTAQRLVDEIDRLVTTLPALTNRLFEWRLAIGWTELD